MKCQIWDTAGQERYRAVVSAYYRGSAGTIIVYDITSVDSFEKVEQWVNEMRGQVGEGIPILIVGNKTDLEHLRKVEQQTGKDLANKLNADFIETSAKSGKNVEEAFDILIGKALKYKELIKKNVASSKSSQNSAKPNEEKTDSTCCLS